MLGWRYLGVGGGGGGNHYVRKPGETKAFFFNLSAPPACNWVYRSGLQLLFSACDSNTHLWGKRMMWNETVNCIWTVNQDIFQLWITEKLYLLLDRITSFKRTRVSLAFWCALNVRYCLGTEGCCSRISDCIPILRNKQRGADPSTNHEKSLPQLGPTFLY